MANIYFNQERIIDPYSEYSASVVNRYHEMMTEGRDCLKNGNSFQVTIDSTSPETILNISTGRLYKDNVSIENLSIFNLDMTDENYFFSSGGMDQAGNYWVVVDYLYIKSRPAPQASFRVFKPDEQYLFNTTQYFFLKCVKVVASGASFVVDSVYDYDLDDSSIHREYLKIYFGTEYTLPTFIRERDESRLVYADDTEKGYYGSDTGWVEMCCEIPFATTTTTTTISTTSSTTT